METSEREDIILNHSVHKNHCSAQLFGEKYLRGTECRKGSQLAVQRGIRGKQGGGHFEYYLQDGEHDSQEYKLCLTKVFEMGGEICGMIFRFRIFVQ